MIISVYRTRERLARGKVFTLFRATRTPPLENHDVTGIGGANPSYILKVVGKKEARCIKSIESLKREYRFLCQVGSPHVIRALDWVEDSDYAAVVLEDIGAVSLKESLKATPGPMKAADFMPLALSITRGLHDIHRHKIIHKDINPANIILSDAGVKIIDFSISSNFDIKVPFSGNPETLQGTLAYISPEQTGRMNRRVDYRSDLYSLGVTFYRMLTGRLPFFHRHQMEVVYSHLARNPWPPHLVDSGIPHILSVITMKLLAKNPEKRYQSAAGLLHDLERAAALGMADFKLGEKDFPGELRIPEKLYGREKETRQLLDVYRRVARGGREMVLVYGYSGTGKTALVNEIHAPVTNDRGYFIGGKFDQLLRAVPYSAFRQALSQFCRLLLTEKQDVLAQWRAIILDAVGTLGKVLTDIVPPLELIIGRQPGVPELGGEEAEKRLNYVFLNFLRAVCTGQHPLVIFIDDWQWADFASLGLLQVLMDDHSIGYLLFIGAYRDNEVSSSHPFLITLQGIKANYGDIPGIHIKNLTPANIRRMLLDTLRIPDGPEVANLTGLVHEKTRGNAFFTLRFLENLYRENLLEFNLSRLRWTWDIKEIREQAISANVVELMVRKIRTLPAVGQEVLKLAACIGGTFDLETLAVIATKKPGDLRRDLEGPLALHLVSPRGNDEYRFGHDRIQQAAYSLIPPKEQKHLHLRIGRLLLGASRGGKPPADGPLEANQRLFDIVNHLNIGIHLMVRGQEKLELLRLNLEAGRHARLSGAYKLSSDYIRMAAQLLPADCWENHYRLTRAVYEEAVHACYLCGDYREMETCVEMLLRFTHDIMDRIVAYEHRMLSLLARNQPLRGEETFLYILRKLGMELPAVPRVKETNGLLARLHERLKRGADPPITGLPLMKSREKGVLFRLFGRGGGAALAYGSQVFFPLVVARLVEISLQYGLAPELPFIFACYGILRNLLGDFPDAHHVGTVSLELAETIPGTAVCRPRTMLAACLYSLSWKEHFKEVAGRLRKNYRDALHVGDVEFAAYSLEYSALYLSHTDTDLGELQKTLKDAVETSRQLKQTATIHWVLMDYHLLLDLTAPSPRPLSFEGYLAGLSEGARGGANMWDTFNIHCRTVFLAYMFEDHTRMPQAIRAAEKAWEPINLPIVFLKTDRFFYIPLAYLRLYAGLGDERDETDETDEKHRLGAHRQRFLKKAKEGIKMMGAWAEFGPVNFLHKYYLMRAELYRVTGRAARAAEYYDKAVEKAFENEYINEAALANELAAKFYMGSKRHKLAALYFMEARDCYRKWGALAKVKHLEENYPRYLAVALSGSALMTGTISSAGETTAELLDVKSIIKASQALSGEVQPRHLLEKMMHILIENAGAQKGVFIENTGKHLLIQAEGGPDGVTDILAAIPPEGSGKVPLSVINFVARSQRKLVFENISGDPAHASDPYILARQPRSVVCFPVLHKNALSALVYLENNLVEGAFTGARLEVLNALSSQIAISMENARVYRDLDRLNKELEQKVAERTRKLKEMDRIKSHFFANISHEFRTPLTLIMGPLEQVLSDYPDPLLRVNIRRALDNSRRLLALINQLLDLSRLDGGAMVLGARRQNIVPFLRAVIDTFEPLAAREKINLQLCCPRDDITLYFDPGKMEKIITNLVANALKFTPPGGTITVTTSIIPTLIPSETGGPQLEISVRDTGAGIPADQMPYIFDRFYQAGGIFSHGRGHRGSGIGLALARELVELHHGKIRAQSTEGEGSLFTIHLPMGKGHLQPGEILENGTAPAALPFWDPGEETILEGEADNGPDPGNESREESREESKEESKEEPKEALVLVVEDNPEVRQYIRGPLAAHYRVEEAADGHEGICKALEMVPDLIVSDIMMPRVDGYRLCDTLKKDIRTSHIPLILLTARASEDNVVEGLRTGADDYVTKPFNSRILLARIDNLITLRRRLQERFQREMLLRPAEIEVSSIDNEFMTELKGVIEKNLSNPDFNVDDLAGALYMARTTLNVKIKALTGESAARFIRSYRLKRAAQLLKARFGNVTQVAFEVGFSSSAYFTRCFKEKFQQLPHTYTGPEETSP